MRRDSWLRRLVGPTLVVAIFATLPAASASAATKVIPVKVKLTGIAGDDLVGKLQSKADRCIRDRKVRLSGDSTDAVTSDGQGAFGFEEGNLFVPGEWSVKVGESKRFGPAGKRKRCGADSATYAHDDPGPMTITFAFSAETGGTGSVSSTNPLCRRAAFLELYRGDSFIAETVSDSEASYTFATVNFASAGNYQVRAIPIVPLSARASGDLDAAECYGQSQSIAVTR